jgi:hypothetical protein
VGRSQLSAVRSHIIQAILHELKCFAWARSTACRIGAPGSSATAVMQPKRSRLPCVKGSIWTISTVSVGPKSS